VSGRVEREENKAEGAVLIVDRRKVINGEMHRTKEGEDMV
jgi:hypothetical protein